MRRLFAVLAAVIAVAITGTSAQATHLDRLPLGCHRVHVTPPGWSAPVEIVVCP